MQQFRVFQPLVLPHLIKQTRNRLESPFFISLPNSESQAANTPSLLREWGADIQTSHPTAGVFLLVGVCFQGTLMEQSSPLFWRGGR
jgi:hypothetical protein